MSRRLSQHPFPLAAACGVAGLASSGTALLTRKNGRRLKPPGCSMR